MVHNLKKNNVIMLARILAMLFIVLCHIIGHYTFIPGAKMLGQFFNCGVQTFFIVSGYLFGGRMINSFGKWLAKRMLTVMFPASFFSLLIIAILLATGHGVAYPSIIAYGLDLEGLLFLNWNVVSRFFQQVDSLGALWFTTIIMLCYLLVPLLQKLTQHNHEKRQKTAEGLLIAAGIVMALLCSKYISLFYFATFLIGYIAGKQQIISRINGKVFLFYSLATIIAIVGRVLLHKWFDNTLLYSNYVALAQIIIGGYLIVIIGYFDFKKPKLINKLVNITVIKYFDNHSYYIYLCHGVFCLGTWNVYQRLSLPVATGVFLVGTFCVSSILKIVCEFVIKASKKRFNLESR